MKSEIAVLGRDERTRAAGAWLAAQGWPVAGPEGAGRAPALLLPMPLAGREEELAGMLEGARPGALALGGRVSGKAAKLAAAGFEVVVNTIPARVLGRGLWQALAPGSLAVELAGEPGGMEEAQVLAAGHTLVRGPALPARVCPVSAGQAVGRATAQILRERGIL